MTRVLIIGLVWLLFTALACLAIGHAIRRADAREEQRARATVALGLRATTLTSPHGMPAAATPEPTAHTEPEPTAGTGPGVCALQRPHGSRDTGAHRPRRSGRR
jgi:hypothetical protein